MTKPITNLAAMMLIDDDKLALDDPVSKYIPAFAAVKVGVESETKEGQPMLSLVPADRPVSIEDLMRHTSGISYDYIGGELIRQAYSQAHILDGHVDNKVLADRIAGLPLPDSREPFGATVIRRMFSDGSSKSFPKSPSFNS
jgi:CubicO group peptidase (beta-lactamase class C family)